MNRVFCKNRYVGCCREMIDEIGILDLLQRNKREREKRGEGFDGNRRERTSILKF